MKQKAISDNPGVSARFIEIYAVSQMYSREYHLFLVIHKNLRVLSEETNYFLNENDIILITPGQRVTFWGVKNSRILDITLPVSYVHEAMPVHEGRFLCNSSIDAQHDYQPLCSLMTQFAIHDTAHNKISKLRCRILSDQILYQLITSHFEQNIVPPDTGSNMRIDRINELTAYIRENYAFDITLETLSEHMHLSATYLSKIFKQYFGMNFISYLREYRLSRSIDALLYTKETIGNIASKYGFYTANTYINAFKDAYGQTPSAYRKQHVNGTDPSDSPAPNITVLDFGEYAGLLENFRKNERTVLPRNHNLHILADTPAKMTKPLWRCGLTIGALSGFILNDIIHSIEIVQKDIGFSYGRIFFVLEDIHPSGTFNISYYSLTQALNILLEHHMIPYLDLSVGPDQFYRQAEQQLDIDADAFISRLDYFMRYCINTFSKDILEHWIFDIGITANALRNMWESPDTFSGRFIRSYKLIKSYLPNAKVGGFNLMSPCFASHLPVILEKVLRNKVYPDFISCAVFQNILPKKDSQSIPLAYSNDRAFALHEIRRLKQLLLPFGASHNFRPPVFMNSLGTTIATRSHINDTCHQATFFVNNTIDLLDEFDLLCYFQMSDCTFSHDENQLLLDGRNGLLAPFGIQKPGYIALKMMARMSEYILLKGNGILITHGLYDTYNILLCNHGQPQDSCCLKGIDKTSLKDAYTIYDYPQAQTLSITLDHINDGHYRIISYHLNRENGSLFDEWEKTGFWQNPNAPELDYLKHALHPKRNCSQRTTSNHQLNFSIHLAPFEVILIEASMIIDNDLPSN